MHTRKGRQDFASNVIVIYILGENFSSVIRREFK